MSFGRDVNIGFPSNVNSVSVAAATLANSSDTVAAGYYEATTLHDVDADLVTGNIKSGVTIFGIAGAATVQSIADANAVAADVANGKTFYSITGGRKTGTHI
jgi:hypothetical protein